MVAVIIMIVDKVIKRSPKNSSPFYTGMCVTKDEPAVIKTLRVTEPEDVSEKIQAIQENCFVMLTNVILSNDSVKTTPTTKVSNL